MGLLMCLLNLASFSLIDSNLYLKINLIRRMMPVSGIIRN